MCCGWYRFSVCFYEFSITKSLKIPKGGNQNLYIEEEQTMQWPKDKAQKNRQCNGHKIPKGGNQNLYIEEEQTTWPRSTNHTYKTKNLVTRTPLKTGVNSDAPEG